MALEGLMLGGHGLDSVMLKGSSPGGPGVKWACFGGCGAEKCVALEGLVLGGHALKGKMLGRA